MRYTAKVVYSKRYRRDDDDDGADIVVPIQAEESLKNFHRRLQEKKYIPIPEKQEAGKFFLKLAREVSEHLQIDTEILETPAGYTANLYLDYALYPQDMAKSLARLIYMSDCMLFYTQSGRENGFVLSLDYNTRKEC